MVVERCEGIRSVIVIWRGDQLCNQLVFITGNLLCEFSPRRSDEVDEGGLDVAPTSGLSFRPILFFFLEDQKVLVASARKAWFPLHTYCLTEQT
jgi:hypothetical protein